MSNITRHEFRQTFQTSDTAVLLIKFVWFQFYDFMFDEV